MSARVETMRATTGNPLAVFVAVVGFLALLTVLTLQGTVEPATRVPVRTPAVATTVGSTPVPAIKAVANDPYVRVSRSWGETPGIEFTKVTVQEPRFGPNLNMGRACPKCW